jgi:hypothetical protein
MSARPIAVIALCAGLLCSACTGGAGPEPGGGGAVPTGTSQPTAHAGQPVVLARNLAVPWDQLVYLYFSTATDKRSTRLAVHLA